MKLHYLAYSRTFLFILCPAMLNQLIFRFRRYKPRKHWKGIKCIFNYNDLFGSILAFLDEKDKLYLSMVSYRLNYFVKKSLLCPIYYKFSDTYFNKNHLNTEISTIFIKFYDVFRHVLTIDFLRTYCICKPRSAIFERYYNCSAYFDCIPCKILHAGQNTCCNSTMFPMEPDLWIRSPIGYPISNLISNQWDYQGKHGTIVSYNFYPLTTKQKTNKNKQNKKLHKNQYFKSKPYPRFKTPHKKNYR